MRANLLLIATLACCWGALSSQASAQTLITCESQNNRRNYCSISDPRANVELAQQLSQAACVRGQSWGNDGKGIWVDRSCRARFRVTSNNGNQLEWWNSGSAHKPSNQPRDAIPSGNGNWNNRISSISVN